MSKKINKTDVTIVGIKHHFGSEVFNIGDKVKLVKDVDNAYDDEAIKVIIGKNLKVGYIANSTYTVIRGTRSAGRIYDTFENVTHARIKYVMDNRVIARVIYND